MNQAARAIIVEDHKVLVMRRNKNGSNYFTLVGGRINEGETIEEALSREIMEETGLQITSARLVYTEDHPYPYNQQYIFLCEVAPHQDIAIQDYAEESLMNRVDINIHEPQWCTEQAFPTLQFRTVKLHNAIIKGLKKGFPKEPLELL